MAELGARVGGPGRIYLTGGASALLEGWRSTTVDVDIKLDPEPAGVFEAIAQLKNELDINIELASPDQFLPPLPGWRERSRFIALHGHIEFFHYDFRSQALAKLSRSHDRDLRDVTAMLDRRLVTSPEILEALSLIVPLLIRYPALDAERFVARATHFLNAYDRRE